MCSLLFHHPGHSGMAASTGVHSHPFWQLEIGVEGEIAWSAGSEQGTLEPGRAMLLPPGCRHGFDYPQATVSWYTLKFQSSSRLDRSAPTLVGVHDTAWPAIQAIHETAAALEPIGEANRNPTLNTRSAALGLLESLLAAIAEYSLRGVESPTGVRNPTDSPIERAEAALRANGPDPMSVVELARRVGVSPGHLSDRVRHAYGVSAKSLIDRYRYQGIERLLRFADAPIKLIAFQTGFKDLYSFSRFVKRVSGYSPRQVRAEAQGVR